MTYKKIGLLLTVLVLLVGFSPVQAYKYPYSMQALIDESISGVEDDVGVSYQTHIQNIGWQNFVFDGNTSGTEGQSLRLESLKIELTGDTDNINIQYAAHIENIGWEDYVNEGEYAGTEGQGLRLESVRIKLTGIDAGKYDVYYRTHVQNVGWMGWAKNGQESGSTGYAYRLEGLQIQVVKKGSNPQFKDATFTGIVNTLKYSALMDDSWVPEVTTTGRECGKIEQDSKMTSLKIASKQDNLGVEYSTFNGDSWTPWASDGAETEKQDKIVGLAVRLTGEDASKYEVFYQVYVKGKGWQPWTEDSEVSPDTLEISDNLDNEYIQAIKLIVVADDLESTLTYVVDGEVYYVNSVSDGGTSSNPDSPNKEKAEFIDWYLDEACTVPYDASKPVKSDTIIYARFDPTYTINFYDGKNKLIASIEVIEGQTVSIEEVEEMTGVDISEWYTDEDLTFDFSQGVTEDVNLYVKDPVVEVPTGGGGGGVPEVVKYTVSFADTDLSNVEVVKDEKVSNPETPVKEGYTFDNFYTTSSYEEVYDFDTTITEDTVIYAKWIANPSNIYFDEAGGVLVSDYNGVTDELMITTTLPAITRLGYTLDGWYDGATKLTQLPTKFPAGDKTYVAHWIPDESTIVFDTKGGSSIATMVGVTDQVIDNRLFEVTTREGFTFDGWYPSNTYLGGIVPELPEKYPVGTTIYYAKWIANEATITFEENGGSAMTDLQGVTAQTIADTTFQETTKAGYSFLGWHLESDFSGSVVTSLPSEYLVGNTVYYARWSANEAVIAFEENGGTLVADKVGVTDDVVPGWTFPEISRAGYTLVGWYDNVGLTGDAVEYLPMTFSVGVTTFYAKWSANPSTLTFNTNGGTSITDKVGVTDEMLISTSFPMTTKVGYTLIRWEQDGVEVSTLPSTYPAGGANYVAIWSANPSTISFIENGGSEVSDLVAETDDTVSNTALPSITRDGYTSEGWFSDAGFSTQVTELPSTYPAGGLTLYAKWVANESTILFVENGGVDVGDLIGVTDQTISDRSMPSISRLGYTFNGWFDNSEFTGDAVLLLDETYPIGSKTYYASWTANPASIVFNSNGGGLVDSMVGVTDGLIVDTTLPSTSRLGYTFVGWFDNSGCTGDALSVLPDKFPVGVTNYYAKWTANESVFSFYSSNGTVIEDKVSVTDALVSDRTMPTVVRLGYTFLGWFDNSEFTGDVITELPEHYPIVGCEYYAKWQANPSTISFDTNGGSAIPDMVSVTDATVDDTAFAETTKSGYTLLGWYENADFSGSVVTEIVSTYPIGSKTYYAKWQANPSTISFNVGGGSSIADMVGVTDEEIVDTTIPETTRLGYTLENWYLDSEFTTTVSQLPSNYPVSGLTFYAKWTANPSTISFVTSGEAVADMVGVTDEEISDTSMPSSGRMGWTFHGWHTEADGGGELVTELPSSYPVSGVTYYAYHTANDITLSFIVGHDSAIITSKKVERVLK